MKHSDEAREKIARLDAKAARHTVVHNGREMVWRRFGDGPPLVLIHGGHGSWQHWIRNIETLGERHTLWVPDLPGFGDSDELDGPPHAPDRMVRLVDALSASLATLLGRGAPFFLVGFSFGSLVAAQLAARRGTVRGLALLGPAGHGGARRERMEMTDWRVPDPGARQAALRHNLLALMLYDPAAADALAMAVHEHSCVKTRFRSKTISRSASLQDALDQYTGPVLLVWGEHDVTGTPEEIAPRLTQRQVSHEWRVLPGAGHWVQYERAEDINRLLRVWFDRGAG